MTSKIREDFQVEFPYGNVTSSFRAFAPNDDPQYYIPGSKDYKYLTPVNSHNLLPKIFLVHSELQDKDNSQNAIALFKHHINHKLQEPELESFFVEGYGIIPAKYLICEGETYVDYPPVNDREVDVMSDETAIKQDIPTI